MLPTGSPRVRLGHRQVVSQRIGQSGEEQAIGQLVARPSLPGMLRKAVLYVVLLGVAIVTLFPFYWLAVASVKNSAEIFVYPPTLVPLVWTFENYQTLIATTEYVRWYANSVLTSAVYIVGSVFFCSLAAFGFAKYEFVGKRVLFIIVVGSMMIPFQIIVIPLYVLMNSIGWVNRYEALIVPWLASAFGIFLMRQYLVTIPSELMDAARIDGASEFRIFYQIIMPLAKPALGALAVFQFLASWNSFLWPLIILRSSDAYTLPIGIAGFVQMTGFGATMYGTMSAASFLAAVPIILLFFLMQRQFIEGLTVGAVKG